jgi:hypothetical protein
VQGRIKFHILTVKIQICSISLLEERTFLNALKHVIEDGSVEKECAFSKMSPKHFSFLLEMVCPTPPHPS